MKRDIELLYKYEDPTSILVYHYDVHTWCYDCKFWLVDGKWCTELSGEKVVGELREEEIKRIKEREAIIQQHEKENQNYIAFKNCRKRTCICKSCAKICDCSSCKGKLTDCVKWTKD